mmetsp:Transcript_47507/g.95032  ORF Transcript_47507/g.95032 Transcript_47507/m.95032 type:complete len:100 (+) Transcript_47507:151-450(+)
MGERRAACAGRPMPLRWMHGVCDVMDNTFSDAYGAWPTAFFLFECRRARGAGAEAGTSVEAELVFRSEATRDAYMEVASVLEAAWAAAGDDRLEGSLRQ